MFFFFFIELWPQEVYYIAGLLILAAFGIFLSSALFGRVWCGYACPQTVYLEGVFRPIQRLIEGPREKRMRREAGDWTFDRVWRRALLWSIYAVISAAMRGPMM